jgi:hypothetical protein
MLTGAVNIAVFAAFWPRAGSVLCSTAEFKRLCRLTELDIARYGRQKRQEVATKWQHVARWAAKAATLHTVWR